MAELRAAHLSEAAVDDFDTRWRIAYDYSAFEDPSRVGPFIFHGPEGIQLEDVQEVLNWFKLRYQPYQQGKTHVLTSSHRLAAARQLTSAGMH